MKQLGVNNCKCNLPYSDYIVGKCSCQYDDLLLLVVHQRISSGFLSSPNSGTLRKEMILG